MRDLGSSGFQVRADDEAQQDLALEQPVSRDLVVSHLDVDGMVAAAAIMRTLPDDAALRFTSYVLLSTVLEGLAARLHVPGRIWVTGLGVEPRDLTRATAAMDALRKRQTVFCWLDHHAWVPAAAAAIRDRCERFEAPSSSGPPVTLMITQKLAADGEFSSLARRIVLERAASSDPTVAAWFKTLAWLMVERDWRAIHRGVRRLSRLEPLESVELGVLANRRGSAPAAIIGDRLRESTTKHGSRYATLDLRDTHQEPQALRHAYRQCDVDFVVTIPGKREVVVDGIGPLADLSRLAGLERLDSVEYVNPYLNPVRIRLAAASARRDPDAAVHAIIDWIDQNI